MLVKLDLDCTQSTFAAKATSYSSYAYAYYATVDFLQSTLGAGASNWLSRASLDFLLTTTFFARFIELIDLYLKDLLLARNLKSFLSPISFA